MTSSVEMCKTCGLGQACAQAHLGHHVATLTASNSPSGGSDLCARVWGRSLDSTRDIQDAMNCIHASGRAAHASVITITFCRDQSTHKPSGTVLQASSSRLWTCKMRISSLSAVLRISDRFDSTSLFTRECCEM